MTRTLQVSVGCRVEDCSEIVVEESIRRRLRRALLDHVFPSASTNSVLKVDEEETPLLTDPGFVLVDTPSRSRRFRSRMSDNIWNEQFGNDWVSVLREGMSWYSGWPVMTEGIRAIDYKKAFDY